MIHECAGITGYHHDTKNNNYFISNAATMTAYIKVSTRVNTKIIVLLFEMQRRRTSMGLDLLSCNQEIQNFFYL